MERRIGRFLFASYTLTVLVGLCLGRNTDIERQTETCAVCNRRNSECRSLCSGNGKRGSPLSDGLNTGGYGIFQASPYKRTIDNQQCSLIRMYNLLPTECAERMDMLVEWARRGLLDDK